MENKKPEKKTQLLSIVIPALNEERLISHLIKNILSNNYKNYEMIVCDNDSKDGTRKIVENFATKHSNIKLVHTEKKGAATARNYGAANAKGEYILFLDADQKIQKTFMENSVNEMKKRNLDIGGYYSQSSEGKFIDKIFWFITNNLLFRPIQYFYPAASTGSGLIVKKKIHDKLFRCMADIGIIGKGAPGGFLVDFNFYLHIFCFHWLKTPV